jgi:hypothetical protein
MPQEIQLVLSHCSHCNTNTTAPSGYKGLVFCGEPCRTAFNEKKATEHLDAEAQKFLAKNEEFYPCPHNQRLLSDLLTTWQKEATEDNLESAYLHLLAEKKILGKLTMQDVNKMDSPTYDARLKIDPAMGGAITDIDAAGARKFDARVSYKTGGTGGWESMAKANLAQRQADADARAANRYRGSR